jgi:hypothetical protein
MSKITDYLPVKAKTQTLVQARVPSELVGEIKKLMERENLSWTDVMTACLRQLLEEKKRK